MQHINLDSKIITARDSHYKFLRYIILKKIRGTRFSESPPILNMNRITAVKGVKYHIYSFLNNEDNLRKVLIGTPEELDIIKDNFSSKKYRESLNSIINYETWIKTDNKGTYRMYNAYNLAENLDIPICTYCNRMYTKTVINDKAEKVTRPTFDHWFPKTKFPLLQLSFYNLIPSCNICNSGSKGSKIFDIEEYFHPYKINNDFKYTFSYEHKDYSKFKFKVKTDNAFSKRSIEAFKLEEIYKMHEDEIIDLRTIKDRYSPAYLDSLKTILKGSYASSFSDSEIYRLAFGVHLEEYKFDRRPLSKMKRDILKELGIIN